MLCVAQQALPLSWQRAVDLVGQQAAVKYVVARE